MAFIREADYEEYEERKRREGRAKAQRPESPWSLMPPAPASPMPGISASQPLPGSQTAPIMPAWAPPPPPPPAPPPTPWQQTQGRYTPEFDEPMPSFMPAPAPGPTIPLPPAGITTQSRTIADNWNAPPRPILPHPSAPAPVRPSSPVDPLPGIDYRTAATLRPEPVIQASAPWNPRLIEEDLPDPFPTLGAGALGTLEAANRYVFDPVSGLATEAAQTEEMERRAFPGKAESIPPRTGLEAGPVDWWTGLGERQAARREAGVPSIPLGDVLPVFPGELRAVGQVAKQAARQIGPEVRQAARALDEVVTSPAVRRLAPGLGVEDVSKTRPAVTEATTAPTFYSALERTITSPKAPTRARAEDWRNFLQAQGVKPDEVKWTGVDDFLNERRGQPVSRQELQDWMVQNRVEVREVVKGKPTEWVTDRKGGEFNADGYKIELLPTGEYQLTSPMGRKRIFATMNEAKERADSIRNYQGQHGANYAPKFSQYTLPGGENYRELLITLPGRTDDAYRQWLTKNQLSDTPISRSNFEKSRGAGMENVYRSSHWDEPNVLAHVRFNERTAADGKRVLFIEEIQSDWHQAGRQKGYQQPTPKAGEKFTVNRSGYDIEVTALGPPEGAGWIPVEDAGGALFHVMPAELKQGVPAAPFAKTWPELALKRVIRYAAENDFDRVAWTTGKQQAERYDLAKVADSISYEPLSNNTYNVTVHATNGAPIERALTQEELPDFLGKDIAQRIVASEGRPHSVDLMARRGIRTLSGLDLSVGGEGMKGFYDTILPEVAGKLGKKFGARVGKTSISESPPAWSQAPGVDPRAYARTEVHSLDIAPQMKAAALKEGFPLFSAPEVGGGVVGALAYQDDPNLSPEENAQRRLLFAAGGAGLGYAGRRLGSKSRLGGTVEDVGQKADIYDAAGNVISKPARREILGPRGETLAEVGAKPAEPKAAPAAATVPPGQPPRAPAGTGQATPPERPGFAGNIRLAKYPEELRDELKAVYDQDPAKFEAARRGVRPDAEVRADAEALIDSVGGKGEKSVRKWSPGQAWNAEEVLALREVLAGRTRNVLDAQRAVREGGDSTENLLRLRLAIEDQGAAQKAVAGVTAEAGRALRQFRQDVGSAIASGDVRRMERLLATRGGREKSAELADKLAKLDIDNPDQVNSFIRGAIKPGMTDYLTELFYNSILSGPKTHMVNAISNTLTALGSPIERAAAAAVEVPLAAIQRRPRERFFGEVNTDAFGLYQGLPEGIRAARYVLKHGFTAEQATKMDFPHQRAFTGKVGEIINAPSTALEMSDQFFRAINNRAAMNALAYRQAAREGLKGNELAGRIADILRDPSKELLEQAERTSMYRLFRQEPGSVASKVIGLREAEVLGFKPLRFVIPFVRTPANLLKFGLERSPAGWLNPKMWGHIAKKDPEAADEIARAALGSMLAAAVAMYAADGRITGAAPTSAAERDRFYREGKQAYAYKVGDTWWQYNRMEPFNQAIGQVAAVVDAINAKDKTADQKAMQAVASIAKGVVSQTYLSGLADFIEGLSDPLRSGEQVGTRVASALAVPFSSAARTIAQATDPVFRRPQGFVETVQANVPGLSENVPARLTAFGEEARRESPLGETFRAVSPISVTPAKSDPVDQELGRLGVEVGFTGKSIRGVALTEDEQRGYQKVAGRVTKADLDAVVTNPEYQRLDERDKSIVLERIIRKARDRAGAAFLERFIGEAEMERRLTDAQAR